MVRGQESAKEIVARQLRKARESMDLDQGEAAHRIGISTGRWGTYERAERSPTLDIIREFPRVFYRPLTWLFSLPDERGLEPEEQEVISLERQISDAEIRAAVLDSIRGQLEAQIKLDRDLRERRERSVSRRDGQ